MPLAGQTVQVLDFTPLASSVITDNELGFGVVFTPGDVVCGVAFIAPRSGRVRVMWHARFESNTADENVDVSVELRRGEVVGLGEVIIPSISQNPGIATPMLRSLRDNPAGTNTRVQSSTYLDVTSLVDGDFYNVRTMHRASSGTGDIFDRSISVTPLF